MYNVVKMFWSPFIYTTPVITCSYFRTLEALRPKPAVISNILWADYMLHKIKLACDPVQTLRNDLIKAGKISLVLCHIYKCNPVPSY